MQVTQQVFTVSSSFPAHDNDMQDIPYRPTREEIERYKRLLQKIPDPNCGRIQELKEKIKDGSLLTKEAIEEAAMRLAARFLGKDKNPF